MAYQRLRGNVPIPEVLGWTEDGGQVFIYMALVEGEILERRWRVLNEKEREAVWKEFNAMVKTWRSLKQSNRALYVGKLTWKLLQQMTNYTYILTAGQMARMIDQPLNDVFLSDHLELDDIYLVVRN